MSGDRITASQNTLWLCVGVGGFGCNTLIRVKNAIMNRLEVPKDPITKIPTGKPPANIAFLAIDTDEDAVKNTV